MHNRDEAAPPATHLNPMPNLSSDFASQTPWPQASPKIIDEIQDETFNPDEIVTEAPKSQFRLGYLDLTCLVLNHVMGTGIFNSPGRVIAGTDSTGAALLLWLLGIVVGLCGVHVYVEYGLNVPRYVIDGVEQTVPRSGGDLHYLHYVYRKPRYGKDTVLFLPCLYGIAFICLGNMAGNSVAFAGRALQASRPGMDLNDDAVRGIAIATAILTCFIHTFSRRGGIILNNIFAIVKIGILLLIIITAIVVSAGGFYNPKTGKVVEDVTENNVGVSESFKPITGVSSSDAKTNGFAQAFLAIVFAFSGFNQTNYVLGEVRRPRKTFPISMLAGAGILAVLYMAVNVCYMVVVPREVQADKTKNIAEEFFRMTFGVVGNSTTGERVFNIFLAISSLGNVIIMTFTAARMKQEIAKEGFLPFARFFAQDYDLSLGRMLLWLRDRGWFKSILKHKWLAPETHQEKTPFGAFVLHFGSCIVLILATKNLTPDNSYNVLTSAWVYLFPAFFGFFLAVGILILRFRGPKSAPRDPAAIPGTNARKLTWTEMTGNSVNPALSVFCAVIYALGCLFPVVVSWIDPRETSNSSEVKWYVIPTIACGVLVFAALWFLGFLGYAKRRESRHHQTFLIERHPEFEWAEGEEGAHGGALGEGDESDMRRRAGGLVLVHEMVSMLWKANEAIGFEETMMKQNRANEAAGANGGNADDGARGQVEQPSIPYGVSDFANAGAGLGLRN